MNLVPLYHAICMSLVSKLLDNTSTAQLAARFRDSGTWWTQTTIHAENYTRVHNALNTSGS